MTYRRHPQAKVPASPPGCPVGGFQSERPGQAGGSAARSVDQRGRGAYLSHLKRLVPPSVVRDDVAYSQPQPGGIPRPRCARRERGINRSMLRGRYQPARSSPSCSSHGQTAPVGASTVKALSMTTSAGATTASPGRSDFFSAVLASTLPNIVIYWPSGESSNMFGSNPEFPHRRPYGSERH